MPTTSTTNAHAASRVVPAHVSFLAIYNPSLSTSDETLRDQIVFYYGAEEQRRSEGSKPLRSARKNVDTHKESEDVILPGLGHDQENERLRQVGLAQGMVDFVK